MIKAVFLDFWGTMFSPSVSLDEYYEIRVKKLHETLSKKISGLSLNDIRNSFWSVRKLCDSVRELHVEVPIKFEIKLMLHHLQFYQFDESFIKLLASSYMYPFVYCTKPKDDLKCFLDKISSLNLRLGLISNVMSGRHVIEALKRWNLDFYFEVMVFSDEVGFRKPRPEIFKYALSQLNVHAEESLMIGDDFKADIEGALNVNMNAIYICEDKPYEQFNYTVKSLSEAYMLVLGWLE